MNLRWVASFSFLFTFLSFSLFPLPATSYIQLDVRELVAMAT